MATYNVDIDYGAGGDIQVEAETLREAIEKAETWARGGGTIPTHSTGMEAARCWSARGYSTTTHSTTHLMMSETRV